MEIIIPNLGDGIDNAHVISILVKAGEVVKKEQTLIELETDKAVAPVPCPENGVIESISINEGDTVTTGSKIGQLSTNGASKQVSENQEREETVTVHPSIERSQAMSSQTEEIHTVSAIVNETPVTSASLTKLAYRIGLDLRRVVATGSGGRITEKDIRDHINKLQSVVEETSRAHGSEKKTEDRLPDFSKWGPVSKEKVSPLRQKIAEKMTKSWQTVPHVTQYCDIDLTQIMALRKKYQAEYQKKKTKLTITVFMIRAIEKALKRYPKFNASYDINNQELILKESIHVGIAVDTENGLIVPVIKEVDKKNILELSKELSQVAKKARERTLGIEELQGGTFTISNLGGLGVGAFTPIINTPEVAILGVGTGETKAIMDKNKTIKHVLSMPMCLSYDHRVIDGADGARFVLEVKKYCESFNEAELKESIS